MVKPILLVSGPPGTGKSTAVLHHLRLYGFTPVVYNASETRNIAVLIDKELERLYLSANAPAVFSNSVIKITAATMKKQDNDAKAIVLEEFDGFDSRGSDSCDSETPAGGSGLSALYALVKSFKKMKTFIPIICIVNELKKSSLRSMSKHSLVQHVKFSRLTDSEMFSYFTEVIVPKHPHISSIRKSDREKMISLCMGDMRQLDNYVSFYTLPIEHAGDVAKVCSDTIVDLTPDVFKDAAEIMMPTKCTIDESEALYTNDSFIQSCMVHENYLPIIGSFCQCDLGPRGIKKPFNLGLYMSLFELPVYISTETIFRYKKQIDDDCFADGDTGCELSSSEYATLEFSSTAKKFIAPISLVRYILTKQYIPNSESQVFARSPNCQNKKCVAVEHMRVYKKTAAIAKQQFACDLDELCAEHTDYTVSIMSAIARALYDDAILSSEWSDTGAFIGSQVSIMSAVARTLYIVQLSQFAPNTQIDRHLNFSKLPAEISKQRKCLKHQKTLTIEDTSAKKLEKLGAMPLKKLLTAASGAATSNWMHQQVETILKLKLAALLACEDYEDSKDDLIELMDMHGLEHGPFIVSTCVSIIQSDKNPELEPPNKRRKTTTSAPTWLLEILQDVLTK